MSPDELTAALEQLPAHAAAEAKLAAEVRGELSALPERAIAVAGSTDAALALKGRALVATLEELSLGALLNAPAPATVTDVVWRFTTAGAAAVSLKARVAAHLMALLEDRRLVPFPSGFEGLARPPANRVCDIAYVTLRELENTSESRAEFTLDRRVFFRLAEAEKDAEIAAAMLKRPFTRYVEDAEA